MRGFMLGAAAMAAIAMGLTVASVSMPGSISGRSPTPPSADEGTHSFPAGTSPNERRMMLDWYTNDELCRGSSEQSIIDATCPKRDKVETALEGMGWCWAYRDDRVMPTDYAWHRCKQLRPAGWRPDPAPVAAAQPPSEQPFLRKGNWDETPGPRSDALIAYEDAIGDVNWRMGLASIALECGLRTVEWYRGMADLYEYRRHQPPLSQIIANLDQADFQKAIAYDVKAKQGLYRWYLDGLTPTKEGCVKFAQTAMGTSDAPMTP